MTPRERGRPETPSFSNLEVAHERLQQLYGISKLLTQFESIERTVPAVLDLLASTLPLESAMLLVDVGALGETHAIIWRRPGASSTRFRRAKAHATGEYAFLVRSAVDLEFSTTGVSLDEEDDDHAGRFVFLPLVVDGRPIFGALQLDARAPFDEMDVVFANAVANQVAIAIDRQAMIDDRQAVSDSARDRAERQVEVSRAELAFARDIAASLAEGVIAVDLDGRITLFNQAAEALVACNAATAIGRAAADLLDLRHADGAAIALHESPFEVAIRDGEEVRCEDRLLAHPRRGMFGVSYACTPIWRGGRITGAVLALRDIAALERAEKEQRFLAELSVRLTGSLDFRETLSAVARFCVPRIADLCFIDEIAEDGAIRRLQIVFADERKQRDLEEDARRFAPRPGWSTPQATVLTSRTSFLLADVEDVAAIAQGPEHAAVVRAIGLRSMIVVPLLARNKPLGVITFALTDSGRRYEARDLQLAEEIARRAALAADNARLFEESRRATAAREDLLALVSHDLKNPLSVILMSLSMLDATRAPDDDRRAARQQLEAIRRAAERMDRLIFDLLDAASIEAGRLSVSLGRTDTARMISDAMDSVAVVSAAKRIRVESRLGENLPPIVADGRRLEQVLVNLLGNAVKFTPDGGTVRVGAERSSSDSVTIYVEDTGSGISEEDLAHLFDRYWQARSTPRLGTGLGLFIVKGIIEAHGSHVRVASTIGRGSTFSFELPIVTE